MSSLITVITPARSRDLTTLATAKEELGITNNRSDARLRRWIREASSTIEDITRRVWATETVLETFFHGFNGGGGTFSMNTWRYYPANSDKPHPLCLARYPVSALSGVTVDMTVLDTGEFLLDPAEGLLFRMSSDMPIGWYGASIAVAYTGGYDLLDDLPGSIEQACLTLLRHRNSASGRDPALRSIEVPGVQSESYWVGQQGENGAVPPEVMGLLAQHIDMRR